MANKTVYPYGTGGSLPASIGLINDLVTGGVDKALTAEQGKVLGGLTMFSGDAEDYAEGYEYPSANITPDGNYYALGVYDSEAPADGTIKKIKANFVSTGNAHFIVGRFDEIHGYLDIASEFDVSITATGEQEVTVNQPISAGYTLFVKCSPVNIKVVVISGTKPAGWKPCIRSLDGGVTYAMGTNVAANLSWVVEVIPELGTVKELAVSNQSRVSAAEENVTEQGARIAELETRDVVVSDGTYNYKIVVENGVLVPKLIGYRNMLVIAHSFGAIITPDSSTVWERGMSSSSMDTDFVAQMNSVIHASVTRVKFTEWEQAFPSPDAKLADLDDYLSADIDLIVIMLGANVASAYRTEAYGRTNFASLINYCKAVATDAQVVVCSPGYTAETNQFNIGIREAAEDTGAMYCSTYSTDSQKFANFGDIVYDHLTSAFDFVINSNGRAEHPCDIWHLEMANDLLYALGFAQLSKTYAVGVVNNTSIEYRCPTKWVAGGRCTIVTFANTAPTIAVTNASGATVSGVLVDLTSQVWDNTPPKTPKYAYHFEMPNSEVTITIS